MRILCSICARGGSKGVKNKNIRLLNGKPLIAYTIEMAKQSKLFDAIAISSDSEEILEVAKIHGADYLVRRPKEMATDIAPKLPVIKHCFLEAEKMANSKFDLLIDLDATSPLREVEDLIGVIEILKKDPKDVDNVITGSLARRSPYFNLVELNGEGYVEVSKKLPHGIFRRQDSPLCYDMNASIYGWNRERLLDSEFVLREKTVLYVMPEERSHDIDSEIDFKIVELLMREKNNE